MLLKERLSFVLNGLLITVNLYNHLASSAQLKCIYISTLLFKYNVSTRVLFVYLISRCLYLYMRIRLCALFDFPFYLTNKHIF